MINIEESLKKGTPPEFLKELQEKEKKAAELKKLQKQDPVKKQEENGLDTQEDSPMDPPNAYEEPGKVEMKKEEMSDSIKTFMHEHEEVLKVTDITSLKKSIQRSQNFLKILMKKFFRIIEKKKKFCFLFYKKN